jgi:hypothetical protein
VDTLVDNLGRHGRGQDDGSLLVARLGPEVGSGLGTGKLTPDVDVVCWSALSLGKKEGDTWCGGKEDLRIGVGVKGIGCEKKARKISRFPPLLLSSHKSQSSSEFLVILLNLNDWERWLTDFCVVRLFHVQSILYDGNTSVGNNTVNRTKGLVNLLEGRLDLFSVSNITLPRLDLDTVLLGEVGSDVVGVLGRVEDDGNVGGSLGEGLGDGVSDTCRLVFGRSKWRRVWKWSGGW